MVTIKDRAGKLHFIGVGGVGVSALAKLALQTGLPVSGSDLRSTDVTQTLETLGAQLFIGHCESNVGPDVETVIYSSAVDYDNPELAEARSRGLEIISRGQCLARFMSGYLGIAVAGSHGKSSTTAMIATILQMAGLDPTVAGGGTLVSEGTNAWLGKGRIFVAEADESDGSFLFMRPWVSVVTNVENDHLDHYGSLEKLHAAFEQFIEQTDSQGLVVVNGDDAFLSAVPSGSTKRLTFGFGNDVDYRVELLKWEGISAKAQVFEGGTPLGIFTLRVPGVHNLNNALAAITVARWLGLPFEDISKGLKAYAGIGRRFQLVGEVSDRVIVDDYAHHPTEVKATLAAARQLGRRVLVVFQPHRYTRTASLHIDFGTAFAEADLVVITDIYSAGEKPIPGVTGALIAENIQHNGHPLVYYKPDRKTLATFVRQLSRPGDVILTVGAGDIWQLGGELQRMLCC